MSYVTHEHCWTLVSLIKPEKQMRMHEMKAHSEKYCWEYSLELWLNIVETNIYV